MKKIILLSVLFGFVTNAAFATYYKTYSDNCDTTAMLDVLDDATVQHRAIITEVNCANNARRYNRRAAARSVVEQVTTSETFIYHQERTEQVRRVKRVAPVYYVEYVKPVVKPVIVESVYEQETCDVCVQDIEPAQPVAVPVVAPVVEDEDDEIVQCEKYGKCAS